MYFSDGLILFSIHENKKACLDPEQEFPDCSASEPADPEDTKSVSSGAFGFAGSWRLQNSLCMM